MKTRLWPARMMAAIVWLLAMQWCGAQTNYDIAPPADWVDPDEPRQLFEIPEPEVVSGVYFLLVDSQVRIEAETRHRYRHIAWKILDTSGLDDHSSFTVDFDPEYQFVTLHQATIRRGDEAFSRLRPDSVEILRREQALESNLIDGQLTLNVVLDDVRVGDIVEYSYTVSGANPALKQHAGGSASLQWTVPVARRQFRLSYPRHRSVHTRTFVTEEEPQDVGDAEWADLRWRADDVPAIMNHTDAPPWYIEMPTAQYSEFSSWSELIDWGQDIYQVPDQLEAPVMALAEQIRGQHPDDREAQLLAALDFVQEDIRYLGIEIGPQSYVPSDPALTLNRRFGDCKDKVLLLLALTKEFGIEGYPVLAQTWGGEALDQFLPSPANFNHMIAQIELHGQRYLLDPTVTHQVGALDQIVQPNYGLVLPLRDDIEAPVDSAVSSEHGATAIVELFSNIDDSGADYEVRTQYTGDMADATRRRIAGSSLQELEKDYLNYMAGYYPGLSPSAAMQQTDHERSNTIEIVESYRLEPFWLDTDTEGRREADFYAWEVLSNIPEVDTPKRSAPLARPHPIEASQRLEVVLGPGWYLDDEDNTVEDPQFVFKRTVRYDGQTLVLDYQYTSKKDHVSPDQVNEYIENIAQARELSGYGLYIYPDSDGEAVGDAWQDVDWRSLLQMAVVTLLVLSVPLVLLIFARTYRHRSAFLNALSAPREGFALVHKRHEWIPVLIICYGIADVIGNLSFTDTYQQMGAAALIMTILLVGPLAGAIRYFLGSWLWHLGAQMLGGKATFFEMRSAYAWGQLPVVFTTLLLGAVAVLTWPALFTVDGPKSEDHPWQIGLTLGLSLQVIFFYGWALINTIGMVAVAQKFTILRSVLSMFVALLIVVVVAVGLAMFVAMLAGIQ